MRRWLANERGYFECTDDGPHSVREMFDRAREARAAMAEALKGGG